MEDTGDTHYLNRLSENSHSGQWQDAIRLLELMEIDYQDARKQLEDLSRTLAERESLVSQRLRNAIPIAVGNACLRLMSYQSRTMGNQIGTAILGVVEQPSAIPKIMRLEVYCLDKFVVKSGTGKVEHWQSGKARSLFQFLMTRPREPVAKEVLMEALWPNCDPKVASNNLKTAMHGLRQTFAQLFDTTQNLPYILFTQGSYQISPELTLWLDVEQFELHWANGRRLQREGKQDEAIREYEMAEALYKGDYLVDDPYEEWTLLRREALKDIYLNILSKLADNYCQINDYESCIIYSLKILSKDACREDAYRWLMQCYDRLGLRNQALRWYDICCRMIKAELDTTPDSETTSLHHQLLKREAI